MRGKYFSNLGKVRRFSCSRKAISPPLQGTGVPYREHLNRRTRSSENFWYVDQGYKERLDWAGPITVRKRMWLKRWCHLQLLPPCREMSWGQLSPCRDGGRAVAVCTALDPWQLPLGSRSMHRGLSPFPLRWWEQVESQAHVSLKLTALQRAHEQNPVVLWGSLWFNKPHPRGEGKLRIHRYTVL